MTRHDSSAVLYLQKQNDMHRRAVDDTEPRKPLSTLPVSDGNTRQVHFRPKVPKCSILQSMYMCRATNGVLRYVCSSAYLASSRQSQARTQAAAPRLTCRLYRPRLKSCPMDAAHPWTARYPSRFYPRKSLLLRTLSLTYSLSLYPPPPPTPHPHPHPQNNQKTSSAHALCIGLTTSVSAA